MFISFKMIAQDSIPSTNSTYKEDQWYGSLSFLLASESIDGFRFNGLSQAFSLGFIRDFPLNQESNKALGLGLGYGISNYGSNLGILKEGASDYQFNLIETKENKMIKKNYPQEH